MILDVKFSESNQSFNPQFGEVHNISDGGFEKGYTAGYTQGEVDGYAKGHSDGLTERQYEVWTITLVDGTIVEKDVALV